MCAEIADEPRFHDKIKQWISEGTVPPFTFVSVETKKKRQARKKRWEAEAEEAKRLGAEMEGGRVRGGGEGREGKGGLVLVKGRRESQLEDLGGGRGR